MRQETAEEALRRFKAQGWCVVTIVLVCAVLASMAAGVLIAYGVCTAMFRLFQMHARQVAVERASVVIAAQVAEG